MTRPSNNNWRVHGLPGNDGLVADTLQERFYQGVGYPLRPVDNVPATNDPEIPTDAIAQGIGLQWAGEWTPGLYYPRGTLVRDDGFLALATTWTQEKPAPIPTQDAEWSVENFTPATQMQSAIVTCVHRYTTSETIWLQQLRVWVPEFTTDYRLRAIVVIDPLGPAPQTRILEIGFVTAGAWTVVAAENVFLASGTTFDVALQILNTSASTSFNGNWVFDGPSNSAPASTGGWNRNNPNTTARFNIFDDAGANRQAALLTATSGTTLLISDIANPGNSVEFLIVDAPVLDAPNSQVIYSVELQNVVGSGVTAGNLSLATFTIPTPASAQYDEQATFWGTEPSPSWLSVVSSLLYDGVDQAAPADIAYGIDILSVPTSFSSDWTLIAANAFNSPSTPIFATGLWGA